MLRVTRERFKLEVDAFVWDFLFKIVSITTAIFLVFTIESDQLLGTAKFLKHEVLGAQLISVGAIFALQIGLMLGIHAPDSDNYALKSKILLWVAVGQALCTFFSFVVFLQLLPPIRPDMRQIDYFYVILTAGVVMWDIWAFVGYFVKTLGYGNKSM